MNRRQPIYHARSTAILPHNAGGFVLLTILILLLSACAVSAAPTGERRGSRTTSNPAQWSAPALGDELVFYDWADDMPQSVLDAFRKEFGVTVRYVTYDSQDAAYDNLRMGEVYDVVVFDNDMLPLLIEGGYLAELEHANIPNLEHIAPNFKNLIYDPHNKHSVPFNWGTTGLVVRTDLVEEVPAHWSDLWDPRYAGMIAVRENDPYDLIGLALKALGYPLNSEDPEQLQDVEKHLLALRPLVRLVPDTTEDVIPLLRSGEIAILVGWNNDGLVAQEVAQEDREETGMTIEYILPDDGALLWGDNYVIPGKSPHKYTAEVFINFLLRPEISAQITNENHYPTPNEAAYPYTDPELRENPILFPASEDLINAEVFLPVSPATTERYLAIWQHFLDAGS